MKKSIFTLLLGILVFAFANVAKAAVSYKAEPVTCEASVFVSTTVDALVPDLTDHILISFVRPDIYVFKDRQAEKIDHYLLKLPNHDLLPVTSLWLLNGNIRLC